MPRVEALYPSGPMLLNAFHLTVELLYELILGTRIVDKWVAQSQSHPWPGFG